MWSELFLVPFLTGLCLAILLPLLGCYLRLRDEWLAALAYSHVAAAGALLALVTAMPPAVGGIAAAGLAGAGKRFFAAKLAGGASYALLLLGGCTNGDGAANSLPEMGIFGFVLVPSRPLKCIVSIVARLLWMVDYGFLFTSCF